MKGIVKVLALTAVLTLGSATAALGAAEGWQADGMGWWYQYEDGTYVVNDWRQFGGNWYHFDANGYMQIGWYQEGGLMYYLDPSTGAMVSGTVRNIDGQDYAFDASGVMTGAAGGTAAGAGAGQQETVAPSAGSWNGNVFTNNWSNYQVTIPAGMTPDESLGEIFLGEPGIITDLYLFDEVQMNGLLVFYQDMNVYGWYTPEGFLREEISGLIGDGDYTTSNIYDVNIGGFPYKKADITMLGGFVHMDICCRQVDHYLMFIIPVYVEGNQAAIDGVLGSMHAVSRINF